MVATSGRGWTLARSLVALIDETDRLYPKRSTRSDGSIGDAAHSARTSDHNPADGWVCAVDITDDKANGCDADALAHLIVARRDRRVKYVIWNRTIVRAYSKPGLPAWTPQRYTGTNPHDTHTHISINNTTAARDDTSPWWQPTPDREPKEEEMALILRGDKTMHWWVTDGVTKRHVRHKDHAAELVYVGLAKWSNNDAFVVPQRMVDSIPTISEDKSWPSAAGYGA